MDDNELKFKRLNILSFWWPSLLLEPVLFNAYRPSFKVKSVAFISSADKYSSTLNLNLGLMRKQNRQESPNMENMACSYKNIYSCSQNSFDQGHLDSLRKLFNRLGMLALFSSF